MNFTLSTDVVAFTKEALERLPWVKRFAETDEANRFKVLSLGRNLSGNSMYDVEIELPPTPGLHPCVRHWFCGSHFNVIEASAMP